MCRFTKSLFFSARHGIDYDRGLVGRLVGAIGERMAEKGSGEDWLVRWERYLDVLVNISCNRGLSGLVEGLAAPLLDFFQDYLLRPCVYRHDLEQGYLALLNNVCRYVEHQEQAISLGKLISKLINDHRRMAEEEYKRRHELLIRPASKLLEKCPALTKYVDIV